MRTLPREPWRGGQICGHQTNVGGWSEGSAAYCGEFKKLGSPLCEEHDREERLDNYGVLPKFAEGNALGLVLEEIPNYGWGVYDQHGRTIGTNHLHDGPLKRIYGFTLRWEPDEGVVPIIPEPEELAAFQAQLKEANA